MRCIAAVLVVVLANLFPAAVYAAPPPIEAFAGDPEIRTAALSPDGTYLAVARSMNGRPTILIYRVNDLKAPPQPLTIDEANFFDLDWGADDRVIVGAYKRTRVAMDEEPRNVLRYFAANPDNTNNIVLMSGESRVFAAQYGLSIIDTTPNEPDTIIMSGYDEKCMISTRLRDRPCDYTLNVYKINIYTGKSELLEKGNLDTVGWGTDAKGAIRYRQDRDDSRALRRYFVRDPSSMQWKKILDLRDRELHPEITPLEATDDPNQIYIRYEPKGSERAEIWTFDTTTLKPVERIAAHPAVDVSGLTLDPFKGEVTGITYWNDWPEVERITDEWAMIDAQLKATFPKSSARSVFSVDRTHTKMVVKTQSEFDYGTWYFVDLNAKKAIEFGKSRPQLSPNTIGGRKRINYVARDGLKLRAYLTLPPGTNGKNLPLILLPHGGPESRDYLGYDFYAQFLASRGYAVVQPQFRGSDGFGAKFTEMGYEQWGLKMQDDLSDAVKYVIDQGVADPARVCIVGHSYGGYAALAGATLTPELYRCVVAVAGVSDLINISRREEEAGRTNPAAIYWTKNMGSYARNYKKFEKTSPARNADKVRAPILLVHGLDDTIVLPEESRLMANALKSAGKPYELIELPGADHSLDLPEAKIRTFKEIERFLKQHNPPN